MNRWQRISDEEFIDAIVKSTNYAQAVAAMNDTDTGAARRHIKIRCGQLDISTAHFHQDKLADADYDLPMRRSPGALRRRLIRKGILPAECAWCHLTEWRGQPVSLELDHIDGDRTNNKLENVRLLCPNCHAQTETYRGRNRKK